MTTEYFTHPQGNTKADVVPAKFWFYMGDGDWVAVSEESTVALTTTARRLEVSRPIDQLPRDGIIMYRTAEGKLEMRRVIEGATT